MVKRAFKVLTLALSGWLLTGCVTGKNAGVIKQTHAESVFNITACGAVDNPRISSTDAFRRAIAECQKAGGGIVRVPAGHFLTGPIDMVDNMTLQVDRGAVVLFETNRDALSRHHLALGRSHRKRSASTPLRQWSYQHRHHRPGYL